MASVRLDVHDAEIRNLARDPGMDELLIQAAEPAVTRARADAPKATGAGAVSIRAEAILDGAEWTARVSWSRDRYYMFFHERGTRIMPARPFLVPAFEGGR